MRRLLNIGTAFVVILSCWGSVLAAPCPHGCHLAVASHMHARTQQSAAEPAGHCHSMAPEGEVRRSPEASVQEAPDTATYAVNDLAVARTAGVFTSAHDACDHCVARAQAPSFSFTEREANQLKKGVAANVHVIGGQVIHAAPGSVKEIIPYEDGPPPSSVHRHVLISVFRI